MDLIVRDKIVEKSGTVLWDTHREQRKTNQISFSTAVISGFPVLQWVGT